LGDLHLLAPSWLGCCPKLEKERTLKPIKGCSANLNMDNYYATLVSWVSYFGAARKGTILVAVRLEFKSSAARLVGFQVRIPSGDMDISVVDVVFYEIKILATGRSLL